MMRKWSSRSTLFGVFFPITGFILALDAKLTRQYVSLVGAAQALIVGRAVAQDYHQRHTPESSS